MRRENCTQTQTIAHAQGHTSYAKLIKIASAERHANQLHMLPDAQGYAHAKAEDRHNRHTHTHKHTQ